MNYLKLKQNISAISESSNLSCHVGDTVECIEKHMYYGNIIRCKMIGFIKFIGNDGSILVDWKEQRTAYAKEHIFTYLINLGAS